jgi:mRNA interferase MazF
MKINHGDLYLADLKPAFGSEPGKQRPVLVVQTNLLNETGHLSTWILPCTTKLTGDSVLRAVLPDRIAGNERACEVMIDQSRSIDNQRFRKHLGSVPPSILREIKGKLVRLGELL